MDKPVCYGRYNHALVVTRACQDCDVSMDCITYRPVKPSPPEKVDVTAIGLLKKAAQIMEERGKQYDKPNGERSMGKCIEAFNAITGHSLSEAEGLLMLQVLKDVRLWQRPGYHADSAEDCIAYAALKAEAKSKEPR